MILVKLWLIFLIRWENEIVYKSTQHWAKWKVQKYKPAIKMYLKLGIFPESQW